MAPNANKITTEDIYIYRAPLPRVFWQLENHLSLRAHSKFEGMDDDPGIFHIMYIDIRREEICRRKISGEN